MLRDFDPARVTVVVGGKLVQGVAPDVFIQATRDNDLFAKVSGTYGDVERTKNLNKSGTITLTLQQTSPTNDLLSGFYTADEQTSTGIFPVLIRDLEGTTMAAALRAWVSKSPDVQRGSATNNVAWVIHTDSLDIYVGGNAS